jgi:acetoin utilization protein AcuC
MDKRVAVYGGDELAAYGFGDGHPFGPDRHAVFWKAIEAQGLGARIARLPPPVAERDALELFHSPKYVDYVIARTGVGLGYLDEGDTPAIPGLYDSARAVVGATLDACARVLSGEYDRAFVPIGGLHHAGRTHAAGFCVFNDCGVAIEWLRRQGVARVAYVDIDAHHGDGVFYGFESDPDLGIADIHEDPRFLYPGTGFAHETGSGPALGTKLNLPVLPGAEDGAFHRAWDQVERYLEARRPEFIIFQCGADSIAGDPITHLRFTPAAHARAAARLCALAGPAGRVVALGGGGYNRDNIAAAWTGVVKVLLESP